ncbi:DUF5621 domain-containing protein [Legionella quateirensis]|uniref:Dot/Icm T4SS effector n=1 Tax=Legionella quateirensis TaxID=45072 RepID=A0A378KRM5_9GAMM|nr:DUF5621 domain-containing protein [Legionella quateirensis]KTD42389.1 Dot/Icm T4SS effector [Legionella quateirensis]STY16251.1 Dot/Icm T4SS effector [Legionella quateirensis]
MAPLTVFAFGTGEQSHKTKNIISQFSEACISDHLIIEGPDWLGREVKGNAKNAARRIVKWLSAQNSMDNTLNLTGFSRGSVTCIHIANRLKQFESYLEHRAKPLNVQQTKLLAQLKALKLNLFAIDPVAGMSDKGEKLARTIPDNVKNYIALLQMDEMRRDFKPQDITRTIIMSPEQTKVSMLPMYGNHSDNTKIKNEKMQSGAKISWYILHHFLTHNGTLFINNQLPPIIAHHLEQGVTELPEQPDAKNLLKLCSLHHKEREHYLISGQEFKIHDGIPLPRIARTLNNHLKYYVKNSQFFTNQLERELFKISYPRTFNYLFEKNQFDERFPHNSASTKQEVIAELEHLRQDDPDLFIRLGTRGVASTDKGITLGNPRGIYYLEPCASIQQIAPQMVPELVKQRSPAMNKLPQLELEVYRLCFRYQREKSELNFDSNRAQSSLVIHIRNEINYIVNNSSLSRDIKHHLILDKIESHYEFLIQSNSSSELKFMLRDLLKKQGRQYQIHKHSLLNGVLIGLVDALICLVRELISFVGNLGYIGGATLSFIGTGIQDLGRRINEVLGEFGYNPLKYTLSALATLLEILGFAVKNSFGLKAITEIIILCINGIKNTLVKAINSTEVERLDNHQIEALEHPENYSTYKTAKFRHRLHYQPLNNSSEQELPHQEKNTLVSKILTAVDL